MEKIIFTALVGAFVGYVVSRFADALREYYKRAKENYNSLVMLELLFNEHISAHVGNLYQISQIEIAFQNAKNTGKSIVSANYMDIIPMNIECIKGLLNIDYLNEIFAYSDKIKRMNKDIDKVNQIYIIFRDAAIKRNVMPAEYMTNFEIYFNNSKELKKYILELKTNAIRLLAVARIEANKAKPLIDRCFHKILVKKNSIKKEQIIESEIIKIKKELS